MENSGGRHIVWRYNRSAQSREHVAKESYATTVGLHRAYTCTRGVGLGVSEFLTPYPRARESVCCEEKREKGEKRGNQERRGLKGNREHRKLLTDSSVWRRGDAVTSYPAGNRNNCCRNLVLSSRGTFGEEAEIFRKNLNFPSF